MMVRWLRDKKIFPDASVDLVYLDPPFNSNAGSKCLILAGLGTQNSSKNLLHGTGHLIFYALRFA
ncbi:MAG: hypothetical protein ABSF10_16485 [Verrucomicrobiota bacterium]|jgi:16S rRNA G966 N2-methylase RsmD